MLLLYLIGSTLCHELGHHNKELNKKRLHKFEKEQKEADVFAYKLLMEILGKLFRFNVSFWMLKGRLHNLEMNKVFSSYLHWYPKDEISKFKDDKIIGILLIFISLLSLFYLFIKHSLNAINLIDVMLLLSVGVSFLFDLSRLYVGIASVCYGLFNMILMTRFASGVIFIYLGCNALMYYFKFFRKIKWRKGQIVIE